MQILDKNTLPNYLKSSGLMKLFDSDVVTIPKKYIIPTHKITKLTELILILDSLRYWMVNEFPDNVFECVINHNRQIDFSDFGDFKSIDQLSLIVSIKLDPNKILIDEVAKNGYLCLLKYLVGKKYQMTEQTANLATNSYECLKFLIENDCPLNKDEIYGYVIHNHNLECVKYLHNLDFIPNTDMPCYLAEVSGTVEILDYLRQSGFVWDNKSSASFAALVDRPELLKYAHENGSQLTNETLVNAIQKDSVNCLEYLLKNDSNCENVIRQYGYCSGIKCFTYIFENGYKIRPTVYYAVVTGTQSINGKLEMLKYIHENKCILPESTDDEYNQFILDNVDLSTLFNAAAEEIELLKFVAEVICPTNRKWTSFTYLSVIGLYEENKIACFKYLYENGCPMTGFVDIKDHILNSDDSTMKQLLNEL